MKASAQDDSRELQMINHCGLTQCKSRMGVDATDSSGNQFELKSGTTKNYISTSTHFGFNVLDKYKSRYWIIASGNIAYNKKSIKVYTMEELYIGTPQMLSFFLVPIEKKLNERRDVVKIINNNKQIFSSKQADILAAMMRAAMILNDPRIFMKDVRNNFQQINHIDSDVATKEIKMFVEHNPITNFISYNTNPNADLLFS